MEDAGVIEEDKIAGLQPVDYRSCWVAEKVSKLTVGRVIIFEPRALERQRCDRAVVVIDGAELFLGVDLEHGPLGSKVDVGILKAIEDRRLTQRGKSVGIMSATRSAAAIPSTKMLSPPSPAAERQCSSWKPGTGSR